MPDTIELDNVISHRLLPQSIGANGQTIEIEGGQIVYKDKSGGLGEATVSINIPSLAHLAVHNFNLNIGKHSIIKNIEAGHECWVRLYPTAALRTEDAGRAFDSAIEQGKTEPILDTVPYAPSNLDLPVIPNAVAYNSDTPRNNYCYGSVQNRSGVTGTDTLIFTILVLEA